VGEDAVGGDPVLVGVEYSGETPGVDDPIVDLLPRCLSFLMNALHRWTRAVVDLPAEQREGVFDVVDVLTRLAGMPTRRDASASNPARQRPQSMNSGPTSAPTPPAAGWPGTGRPLADESRSSSAYSLSDTVHGCFVKAISIAPRS